MNFQELKTRSAQIKELVEELRAETYITVEVKHSDKVFYFFASFNIEACKMEYNITDEGFVELKMFSQVPPEVVVEYGKFVENMLNFEAGAPMVYSFTSGSKPMSVADLAAAAHRAQTEEDIDDSEASLR